MTYKYSYTDTNDKHIDRRKKILEEFPNIKELYGNDIRSVPIVMLMVFTQICISYYQKYLNIFNYLLVAYIFGGTINHSLALIIHEASHNLVFSNTALNEYFGIFCNIAMAIPSSSMFRRYHIDHHIYLGTIGKDTDIATEFECYFFTNSYLKIIWLFFQPFFYALRPVLIYPKKLYFMDYINISVILLTDLLIFYYNGYRGLLYLLLSSLLGLGLHPMSGHFIAEHYIFTPNNETYSYYGILNYLSWNVGYHNEHHDFPKIPGSKLPLVKNIANKYYSDMYQHPSWINVLYYFITSNDMNLNSRMVREKVN